MTRIISYYLRFKTNFSNPKQKLNVVILASEINHAKMFVVKLMQNRFFFREIEQLRVDNQVLPKNRFYWLRPFLTR